MTPEGRQDRAWIKEAIALCANHAFGCNAIATRDDGECDCPLRHLLALLLAEAPSQEKDYEAFADRLWYRWQAEKLSTGSDHKAYQQAVAGELTDMRPPKAAALLETRGVPQEEDQKEEHDTRVDDSRHTGAQCAGTLVHRPGNVGIG